MNKKITRSLLLSALVALSAAAQADAKLIEHNADGSKQINIPFVHVHTRGDDNDHVKVDAPFVHVNRPADNPSGTTVRAPFTHVRPDQNGMPSAKAPWTRVNHDPDGTAHIKAPFTHVDNPNGTHNANVKAPFAKVQNGERLP